MERKKWTQAEEAAVSKFYPNTPTKVIAAAVGRSESAVYQLARRLGLKKSDAYFASEEAGRFDGTRGEACRFPKGHEPWNKGTSFTAGGRSAETRFKKGCMSGAAQHNYVPIGSTRLSKDGYLERKTNDEHPVPARRWVAVHRLVWEAARGPIPPRYVVVFKPGMRTNVEDEITLDRLECISQADNMRRNTLHRYPKEIARAIQLRGALNRRIRNVEKHQ